MTVATSLMLSMMLVESVSAVEIPQTDGFNQAISMSTISPKATNYFTGSTVKMNSLNGIQSTISNISSGSVLGTNPQVTSVKLNVTVSPGSSSFRLYVEDPNGNWDFQTINGSGTVTFNLFQGVDPSGKWKVYIITNGTVSTATARMTVNYNY